MFYACVQRETCLVYGDHRIIWLLKFHKIPCNSRENANSSSCSTTVFSVILTSCLIAIKTMHDICEIIHPIFYERNGKITFYYIKF